MALRFPRPLAAGEHTLRLRFRGALRRDLLSKRGLRLPESAWNEADTVERPDLERARRLF